MITRETKRGATPVDPGQQSPGRQRRLGLSLGLALAATGCSLVVGDIELPEQSTNDTGGLPRDGATETDASPGGNVVPADAAPLAMDGAPLVADVAPVPADGSAPPADASVTQPDIAPLPVDAFIPLPDVPTAPPPDLSGISGFWYVDGFAMNADGQYESYAAALRIERRRADLLTNDAQLVAADVSLVPAQDLYGTWLLTMPTTGVVYRGAFAPNSGFAVFAPDTARDPGAAGSLLLLARANEDAPAVPPVEMVYARIGRAPEAGDAEFGSLRKTAEDTYVQESRYPAAAAVGQLPDRFLGFWNLDPWRWTLSDPSDGSEFELVPTFHGEGVIGVERRGDQGGVSLMLGWGKTAAGVVPRAGDLFCGGLLWDENAQSAMPVALSATMAGDGSIAWVGGYTQVLTEIGGVYLLDGGLNPFLQNNGVAIGDGLDELLVIMPFDYQAVRTVWGMMACVRTDLIAAPI